MTYKKRNPTISGILSLIQPGVGQLYNGEVKKSILHLILPMVIIFIIYFSPLIKFKGGFYIALISVFLFRIYSLIDASRISDGYKDYELRKFNNVGIYLLLIFGWGFLSGFVMNKTKTFSSYKSFKIPTPSMENTLLIGDFLIADSKYYNTNLPSVGEVVLFYPPNESNVPYIQRVMGTAGDTVKIDSGKIYLNGELILIPETQTRTLSALPDSAHNDPEIYLKKGNADYWGPYVVPENKVFLIGDNRDNSFDSRFFGFVENDKVFGKPLYIWYSHEKGVPRFERFPKEIN